MILQLTNKAEYDQPITLHTGESKTVTAGTGIKINTSTDKRLINYYASLVNYEFDIVALEASGQELNVLEDAMVKLNNMRRTVEKANTLQDLGTYPEDKPSPTPRQLTEDSHNPVTLDKIFNNEPISQVSVRADVTDVPRVEKPPRVAQPISIDKGTSGTAPNPIVMDGNPDKILDGGVSPIPDFTQQLPPDYPEDPSALAAEREILKKESEITAEKTDHDNKYAALDELEEGVLRKLLLEKFEENTKLKVKWKIINHIIDLANEEDINVFDLIEEYK